MPQGRQGPEGPLGDLDVPSGILVVVDPDVLWLWRHDAEPLYPSGHDLDEERLALLNDAVDLRIEGADAIEVGERLGREWHPLYLYDVPRSRLAEFEEEVGRVAANSRLDARAAELPGRVTHRERVDQALEIGAGAGIVSFRHEAVAVAGVEPGGRASVRGAAGEVVVELAGGEAAATLEIGPVPVEEGGRLAVADLDALADPESASLVAFEAGEGLYPVFRELDAEGRLLRVRIALGG